MIGFSSITAFWLVRRLVLAEETSVMYLLLHEKEIGFAVEADLQAEVEVQVGIRLQIAPLSAMFENDDLSRPYDWEPIRAFRIGDSEDELTNRLDTHVILQERSGSQLLFLTTPALAKHILSKAPNFRNRITEVLQIVEDDPN